MSFVPSSVSPTFHGVIWNAAVAVAALFFFLSTPWVNCALIRLHPTTIPCTASVPGDTGFAGTHNPNLPTWYWERALSVK